MARNRKQARTGYASGGAVDNQYANVKSSNDDTVKPGTAAEWTPEAYQASLRQQEAQGYAGGGMVRQNFRGGGHVGVPDDPRFWSWEDKDRYDAAMRPQPPLPYDPSYDDGAVSRGTATAPPTSGPDAGGVATASKLVDGYAGGGAVRRGYADGGTVDDSQGASEYERQLKIQQEGQRQQDLAAQRQAEIERQAGAQQPTQLQPQTEAARQSELTAQAEEQKQAQTTAENQRQAQAAAQQPQGPQTPWYRQVYDKMVSGLESARTAVGEAGGQLATGFQQGWQGDTSGIRYTGVDAEGKPRSVASVFAGEGQNPYVGNGPVIDQAKDAIHNFLWGEGSHTPDQLTQLQESHPSKDLNKALQDAMTKAELAGDHATGQQVLQTARKAYDLPRGYAAAAFDKGDPDNGLAAWQRGFNQIPNNMQMDVAKAPAADGRYMVKLSPEKAGQGEAKEYWMSPAELRRVQEAATFDNVVQHGLSAIIDSVTGKTQPLVLPEPGATATIGPDGRPVYRATYDMTGMVRPGASTEDRGFYGLKSVTDQGGKDLTGHSESQQSSSSVGEKSSSQSQGTSSQDHWTVRPPSYFENPAYTASLTELPRPRGNIAPGYPMPPEGSPQPIGPQVPPGFTPPTPQQDVFQSLRTPGGAPQRPQEYTREEAIRYNAQLAQQQAQFGSPRAGDTAYEARNRQLDQRSGYAAAMDAARAAEQQQAAAGRTAEVARTNEISRRIQAGEPVGLGHSEQSRPDIPLPPRQAATPESRIETRRETAWRGQPYTAEERAADDKQLRELGLIRGRGEAPVAVAEIKQQGIQSRADQKAATAREHLDFSKSKFVTEMEQKSSDNVKDIMRTIRTKIPQGQPLSEDEQHVYTQMLERAKEQKAPVPTSALTAAPAAAAAVVSPEAVDLLRKNPHTAAQFNAKYGVGAAERLLNQPS